MWMMWYKGTCVYKVIAYVQTTCTRGSLLLSAFENKKSTIYIYIYIYVIYIYIEKKVSLLLCDDYIVCINHC